MPQAMDPNRAFKVETVKCYARRAIDKQKRKAQHKNKDKQDDGRWEDGLIWYVGDSFIPDKTS